MEESNKKYIHLNFGRKSTFKFEKVNIPEILVENKNEQKSWVVFDETKEMDSQKMLGMRNVNHAFPLEYISARSLSWLAVAKWLPPALQRIYENELISPFKIDNEIT